MLIHVWILYCASLELYSTFEGLGCATLGRYPNFTKKYLAQWLLCNSYCPVAGDLYVLGLGLVYVAINPQ